MTIKSNKLAAWAGAAAFALLTPLAYANPELVTNGGFETGDLTGWTETGDLSLSGVGGGAQHSGSNAYSAGPTDGGIVTITQMIATAAGESYKVDFWLQLDDSATPNSFSWSWNGIVQSPLLSDAAAFQYKEYSAFVSGVAGSSTLQFSFSNLNSFYDLDDVSVQAPEPGSLALMGIALLAAGAMRRRKTQA